HHGRAWFIRERCAPRLVCAKRRRLPFSVTGQSPGPKVLRVWILVKRYFMMRAFKPRMEAFPMMRRLAPIVLLLALSAPAFAQWNEDAQDCYEDTKPESFNPEKALPACERAMRSGELTKRNLAQMYYYRGTIWMDKKDYKRAIEDFTQSAELDPTTPQS